MISSARTKVLNKESVFTGGFFAYLGISIVSFFLSLITLGIAFPWLFCWKQRWIAENTYINGEQLYFDGKGIQLIGKWLLWLFLCLVTLLIFSFWIPIKVTQWKVKHTCFMNAYRGDTAKVPACKPKADPVFPEIKARAKTVSSEMHERISSKTNRYASAETGKTEMPNVKKAPEESDGLRISSNLKKQNGK